MNKRSRVNTSFYYVFFFLTFMFLAFIGATIINEVITQRVTANYKINFIDECNIDCCINEYPVLYYETENCASVFVVVEE